MSSAVFAALFRISKSLEDRRHCNANAQRYPASSAGAPQEIAATATHMIPKELQSAPRVPLEAAEARRAVVEP